MSAELEGALADPAERDLQRVIAGGVAEVPDATEAHKKERRPTLADRRDAFRRDLVAVPQADAERVTEIGRGSVDVGDGEAELRKAEDRLRAELAVGDRRSAGDAISSMTFPAGSSA